MEQKQAVKKRMKRDRVPVQTQPMRVEPPALREEALWHRKKNSPKRKLR
jgi:hypothetical protein